jgi:hypothetical protein
MRTLIVLFIIVFLGPRLGAQSVTPGTYRVWLCSTNCTAQDSANSVAEGFVVIYDDSAATTAAVASALAKLPWIRTAGSGIPNACIRVTKRQRTIGNEELYFGIIPAAATRVRPADGGGFVLATYASPDAFYDLRWAESGVMTSGTGWSAGWRPSDAYHRNAFFVAVRVGPPQWTDCLG